MRAVLQRVSEASVEVDGQTIGQINSGLMILICAMEGDHADMLPKFAAKIAKLRIFSDETGRMNKSVLDQGGAVLLVSQFTLAGDTSRGNRPGFSSAAPPDLGKTLYEGLGDELAKLGITVARGQFGADMKVRLVNDGPVTIWMDSTA